MRALVRGIITTAVLGASIAVAQAADVTLVAPDQVTPLGLPANPLAANDPQNAPYGKAGSVGGTAPTPGGGTVAPGRNIHIFCPPSATAGSGSTTLTLANGDTVPVELANGAQYDLPYAVTQVAAQTQTTGTLGTCAYRNMN